MSLTRWEPMGEIARLREAMDRLFDESFSIRPRMDEVSGFPVDVYEQDNAIVVEADLPGVKPEELDIEVQDDQLKVSAQSEHTEEVRDRRFYRRERVRRRYDRVIALPTRVEADQAKATFENGHLRLHLPVSEEARPRRIPVGDGQGRLMDMSREQEGASA